MNSSFVQVGQFATHKSLTHDFWQALTHARTVATLTKRAVPIHECVSVEPAPQWKEVAVIQPQALDHNVDT